MASNLARQAEAPSALGFLERAQCVHQGAAEALQQGLQPLEQREAGGQVRATLGQTFGRRRIAAQVARLVEPLRELARSQAEKVAGLAQAVSTTLRAVVEMAPEIQSSIRQAAARLTADPERIRRRKIEERRRQELDAIRARLLQVRMIQWSEKANQGWSPREDRKVSEARQARGKEAEEGMKAEITAIPEAELRSIEAQWKLEELKRGAEQNARPTRRPRSPGPGM